MNRAARAPLRRDGRPRRPSRPLLRPLPRPLPTTLCLLLIVGAVSVADAGQDPAHEGHHHPAAEAPGEPAPDPHAGHRAMLAERDPGPDAVPASELEIPDVEVVTHEGRRVHFYTDLIAGKTVAMNFVFTTCTTICPPMGAIFGRLQDELGDRLGDEVHLVSVSVDPATDTPERLAAWAANFQAREGWTLVTGDTDTVERLLKALGVFTADVAAHAPVALIGHDPSHTWTRTYGLSGPADLAAILDEVSAAEPGTAGDGSGR